MRRIWLSPMALIVLTIFVDAIGFGLIFPLLPFYAETFQTGAATLGVLIASFALMNFVFPPILGRISDSIERKPILLISIIASIASYIIFALANSFWTLLLSRIIGGAASERAVAGAYVADITTHKERVTGMGKVGAAYGAGFIVGPAIGGILEPYGYPVIGFAAAILTLTNLLFVLFFLPESLNNKTAHSQTIFDSGNFLSRIRINFSNSLIRNLLTISFVSAFAFSAIPVILPLIGAALYGFGGVENSYIFMYIGFLKIFMEGLVIGRLAEKFDEETLLIISSLITAVGVFLIPILSNIGLYFFFVTMMTTGAGFIRTLRASLISKNTSETEQGTVIGVEWAVASIARVPGPLIAGALFEFAGIPLPFIVTSIMFALVSAIGYKTFLSRTRPKKKRTKLVVKDELVPWP